VPSWNAACGPRPGQARDAKRARIVLLAADGRSGVEIAERVGVSEPTVIKWRRAYTHHGLAGLVDAPRSGRPREITPERRFAIWFVSQHAHRRPRRPA